MAGHMYNGRETELLIPASSLEVLKIAVIFGADAVYIGAPKFGARAAAVNSLEDIEDVGKTCSLVLMPVSMSQSIRF